MHQQLQNFANWETCTSLKELGDLIKDSCGSFKAGAITIIDLAYAEYKQRLDVYLAKFSEPGCHDLKGPSVQSAERVIHLNSALGEGNQVFDPIIVSLEDSRNSIFPSETPKHIEYLPMGFQASETGNDLKAL